MNPKQKKELINKLAEISSLLGMSGAIMEDGQSLFIAHSIMTVLKASQNEKHAMALSRNLINFVDEIDVLEGEKSIAEFLEEKISQN